MSSVDRQPKRLEWIRTSVGRPSKRTHHWRQHENNVVRGKNFGEGKGILMVADEARVPPGLISRSIRHFCTPRACFAAARSLSSFQTSYFLSSLARVVG